MEVQQQLFEDPVELLSGEEHQAVEAFFAKVNNVDGYGERFSITKEEAIKYLMARKFDVDRALSLFFSSRTLRQQFELENFDISKDPLNRELLSGKFTVLNGQCADNSKVCLFYAHKHFPKLVDHITVIRSIVFQLDCILKSYDVQRNGISFVYNMESSSFQNFDLELARKVLHLLKDGYPARLKNIHVVSPLFWFRASFLVLSSWLKEKIRDRVILVKDLNELHDHVPQSILPKDMNGNSDHDHAQWILECTKSFTVPKSVTTEDKPDDIQSYAKEDFNNAESNYTPNEIYSSKNSEYQTVDVDPPNKPLPPPPENPFTIDELLEHMANVGRKGIQKEYDELRSLPPCGSFESTLHTANLQKNRYNNILAFEETRVCLQQINGDPHSDYINANYLDSITTKKKFICTQGPMPQTYFDFWRMIWEHSVSIIIMITRCTERGRGKCGQYWPEQEGRANTFGYLVVTNLACDIKSDFTTTLFELTNTLTRSSLRVYHVQFTSWPDFGVLSSATPILDVLDYVELYQEEASKYRTNATETEKNNLLNSHLEGSGEYQTLSPSVDFKENYNINCEDSNTAKRSPIVVHCSAGVGRTGTFCCLSNCIDQIESLGTVDVYNTVKKIRDQRAFSVQTPEQYEFGYTSIIEYLIRQKLKNDEDVSELESFLYDFKNSQIGSDSE